MIGATELIKKVISAASLILCVSFILVSCGEDGKPELTGEQRTSVAVTTAVPALSEPVHTTALTEIQTAADTTAAGEPVAIDVKWHFGYIGSSAHGTYPYIINNSGTYYSYTDVIRLERAGSEIYFTDDNTNSGGDTGFASGSALVVSSWYEKDGKWLIDKNGINIAGSGTNGSVIAENVGGAIKYRYISSKDNEYIRLSFRSGQTSAFIPAAYPTVYFRATGAPGTAGAIAEGQVDYDRWIEQSKLSSYFNNLEGKTMYVLGDSYFAGDSTETKYVWCSLLAAKYGMTYNNQGKNGSSMSDYVSTNSPMVSRYAYLPSDNADIILLEGGKNDFNLNVPIGTDSDTSTKTYKGALRCLIEKLRGRYPGALIVCVTVWNVDDTNAIGKKVTDYGYAMMEVAALLGVPCFNAMDITLSGVDMTSSAFRAEYCQTPSDVSHLNAGGHRMVMPSFEKFIAEAVGAHGQSVTTPAVK